ncbi:MAG: helix-turn-helix domain-containing protein [Reichenbachiella sp.]|uniref:helix-turn-helix domain-containing protein n=1 Tax=Reichenbachiella sp. TaxID=2184521 RepID=UPI003297DC79
MEESRKAEYYSYEYTNQRRAKPRIAVVENKTNSTLSHSLNITVPSFFVHNCSTSDNNHLNKLRGKENPIKTLEASYYARLIHRMKKVVLDQLDDNSFTIDDLACTQNMSVSSLKRTFKKIMGMSPGKFIREIRLQTARTLLLTKQYTTIKEVVYAVGFDNASHFSKLYHERFGQLPSSHL